LYSELNVFKYIALIFCFAFEVIPMWASTKLTDEDNIKVKQILLKICKSETSFDKVCEKRIKKASLNKLQSWKKKLVPFFDKQTKFTSTPLANLYIAIDKRILKKIRRILKENVAKNEWATCVSAISDKQISLDRFLALLSLKELLSFESYSKSNAADLHDDVNKALVKRQINELNLIYHRISETEQWINLEKKYDENNTLVKNWDGLLVEVKYKNEETYAKFVTFFQTEKYFAHSDAIALVKEIFDGGDEKYSKNSCKIHRKIKDFYEENNKLTREISFNSINEDKNQESFDSLKRESLIEKLHDAFLAINLTSVTKLYEGSPTEEANDRVANEYGLLHLLEYSFSSIKKRDGSSHYNAILQRLDILNLQTSDPKNFGLNPKRWSQRLSKHYELLKIYANESLSNTQIAHKPSTILGSLLRKSMFYKGNLDDCEAFQKFLLALPHGNLLMNHIYEKESGVEIKGQKSFELLRLLSHRLSENHLNKLLDIYNPLIAHEWNYQGLLQARNVVQKILQNQSIEDNSSLLEIKELTREGKNFYKQLKIKINLQLARILEKNRSKVQVKFEDTESNKDIPIVMRPKTISRKLSKGVTTVNTSQIFAPIIINTLEYHLSTIKKEIEWPRYDEVRYLFDDLIAELNSAITTKTQDFSKLYEILEKVPTLLPTNEQLLRIIPMLSELSKFIKPYCFSNNNNNV